MRNLFCFGVLGLILSCSTTQDVTVILKDDRTFKLTEISTDPTYGFSEKNPVQVGGVDKMEGPLNEIRYLNALAGPNGEDVYYYRLGSCCPIKSKNDPFGAGVVMLDNYLLTWEGAKDTVSIYINMYDYGELRALVGFTIKE